MGNDVDSTICIGIRINCFIGRWRLSVRIGVEKMNSLADAVRAIESCTKAERNYLRLWLNGELDQIFEEVKEMKTNE